MTSDDRIEVRIRTFDNLKMNINLVLAQELARLKIGTETAEKTWRLPGLFWFVNEQAKRQIIGLADQTQLVSLGYYNKRQIRDIRRNIM